MASLSFGVDEWAAATEQDLPTLTAEQGELLPRLLVAEQHPFDELDKRTQAGVAFPQAGDGSTETRLQLQVQDLVRGAVGGTQRQNNFFFPSKILDSDHGQMHLNAY